MTTEEKLDALLKLRAEIVIEAAECSATSKETCPLEKRGAHHELSQMLVGCGCWEWTCPFCAEKCYE